MSFGKNYIPDRGDIIYLNFSPQAGKEQKGKRPAFVLSPFNYNQKVGLALMCPITTHEKGYSFEVKIPDGLNVKGVILSDHVKNLDYLVRESEFVEKAPQETIEKVQQYVKLLIG